MAWTTPAATDLRFGFEITMYFLQHFQNLFGARTWFGRVGSVSKLQICSGRPAQKSRVFCKLSER
jgi:coenzyme PQQ precursor peptide PqqA